MFDLIASILAFFYDIEGVGYGGSIILLTLVIMVALTPLTLSGTRSMMRMQQLQPELKRLQREHKDDRQAMNEEMMAFYKANNINPVGGCLPLLVQMPVFLVLFRVLNKLTNKGADGLFDPSYLSEDSQLFQDLSESSEMPFGPFNLAISANDAIQDNFFTGLPYLILILFVAGTSIYQQRQIQGRNPNAEVNPQQQMIMKFLPISFAVFSFWFATGLVVYWATSNLYRVGQQAWISRTIYGTKSKDAAVVSKGTDSGKGGDAKATELGKKKEAPNGDDASSKNGGGRGGNAKGGAGKNAKNAKNAKKSNKALPDKRKAGGRAKGGSGNGSGQGGKQSGGRQSGGRTTEPGSPQKSSKRSRKKK
ncbi:MAG: YidC/Oxa1 family membrane protein insertase [Actinomycetia bacterium]|nr:YidC/Oxa1 family membrane protein insertase [Actinomycetes bacterium]